MQKRLQIFTIIVIVALLLLIVRSAQLQLFQGEDLAEAAVQQRLRVLREPAPRGEIVSADGTLLAGNRAAFVARYFPSAEPLSEDTLQTLSEILDLPADSIQEAISRQTGERPYAPVNLKVDLTEKEATELSERRYQLPGISIGFHPIRNYPNDNLAVHVLGHTSNIKEDELRTFGEISERDYHNRDVVGRSGVERSMEFNLQGWDGEVRVEVDAHGRLVDSVTGRERQPGDDVHLTIDSELQKTAERALSTVIKRLQEGHDPVLFSRQQGRYIGLWDDEVEHDTTLLPADSSRPDRQYSDAKFGAVAVLDVTSGKVLAKASYPQYDLSAFATAPLHLPGSEQKAEWNEQYETMKQRGAFLNRVTSDPVAPGSIFKMVTALAALRETDLDPDETVRCQGSLDIFGQSYGCWKTHGRVDLTDAIAQSCNVYFYEQGLEVGVDGISEVAAELGLGASTGILGLPPGEERSGIRPSREWKKVNLQEPWYPGETLMAAIGQGYHSYTPLQITNYVAGIANEGVLYRPYLVDHVKNPDGEVIWKAHSKVISQLDVDEEMLKLVVQGMKEAVLPGGSARWRFWDYPRYSEMREAEVMIAAKTGTAEVRTGVDSHGWFTAFAPTDEPEIAVAAVIHHGGGGSLAAAPVVRAVMQQYFGFSDLPQ